MTQSPTLRQLEYAVAVAQHGSFGKAATACHVSQPGLSMQIRELESLLEVQIFERDRRTVIVTPIGAKIIERAIEVLGAAAGLVELARASQKPLTGILELGVIPTIAPYLLPRVLSNVRDAHPDLVLHLREGMTADLVDRLHRGALDVILIALGIDIGEVETLELFEEPFVVAVGVDHELAARKTAREDDLGECELLLLEDGHCLREQTLALCRRNRRQKVADLRASSLATLVEMVASGIGATLLPRMAADLIGKRSDLVILPFRPAGPGRTIGLAWRRTSGRGEEFKLLARSLIPEA